jgi:AcrR family transcriptional regulator
MARANRTAAPAPRADGAGARHGPHDRILEAAYQLFTRHGIRAVGIDRIVAESGVAKMTLYRHFASKEDLVLAFLELREQRWTHEWLKASIERTSSAPDRVLAMFDVLDEWFHRPDYESCSFIKALLEVNDPADPINRAAVAKLDNVKTMLTRHASDAGLANAEDVAAQVQILMMGAIVSATRGDREAAHRARAIAQTLLASS